jgi:HEAT repeat protein
MIDALDAEDYFQWVMMKGFVRLGEPSVEPLCQALQNGDVTTRRNAGFILFHISWRVPNLLPVLESKALGPLTDAIDDDDQVVRSRAIETLGRMEGRAKPSLESIIAALHQPDPPLRSIADAARRIGPQVKHVDDLFDGVRRMKPGSIPGRESVARTFGAAISAAGKETLGRAIEALDDPREIVRKTAMFALYELGPQAAPAVPTLIKHMNSGDRLALDVLAAIGPQAADAIPHLISQMELEVWVAPRFTPPRHRPYHPSKCAAALASIGPVAIPALLDGLKHKNDLVRAGCLCALAKMDTKANVPLSAIVRLCHDDHVAVRGLAFYAIIQRAGDDKRRIIPILERLQMDTRPEVAEEAKYHIDRLKGHEAR